MTERAEDLKTIWYFVGIVLTSMGVLVFMAGMIELISPAPGKTVLADLYPGIWWGGIMVIAGLIFLLKNKGKVVTN